MEKVIWCGKQWLNNCGHHYIEPVFGVKRFERAEKKYELVSKTT